MTRDDGGSAAALVVLMLPLLIVIFVGVLQLGALRVIALRAHSAADLATLAAVDDQDEPALTQTGSLRLAPDAAVVARRFFAMELDPISTHLDRAPERLADEAGVAAFPTAPAVDAVTGATYERPAVRLVADVPIRTPGFAALLLPAVTVVRVLAVSSPR